jgi:cephalosporin-C deacetylase-like acetyl esterase
VYDNRNWGESDGKPRNQIDPFLQARDYWSAFDCAASLPDVDETKIVYWGSSMSGGTALFASSIDKRIKGVITQVPFASDDYLRDQRNKIRPLLFSDQQEVGKGAAPIMIDVHPKTREEAESGLSRAALPSADIFVYLDEVERRGFVPMEKKVTLHSMLNLCNFDVKSIIHRIAPTPLLMVVADNDITVPTAEQLLAFQRALEPKKIAIIGDAGHFDVYMGKKFEENIAVQLQFLSEIFA